MTLPNKERVADADGNPWGDGISATVADWSREAKPFFAWDPSRSLLASLRSHDHHMRSSQPWHLLMRRVAVLRHRVWSVVTGADIPLGSKIGGGLLLPHPNGVVIHTDAEIGPNCLIFQQVTIGMTDNGVPSLGGHVDLGAGAKVLGGIHVGNHSRVGANAVVLIDVPVGAVAAGVPAQIVWPREADSDRKRGTEPHEKFEEKL
jgi:serine O-acetyltransferase